MSIDLMSLDEAAEYLGFTPATLLYKRHKNEGPPSHKLAGRVVYAKADLDDYVVSELARTRRGG
jgi:predicted DNA-binding transcriptional regulator AlpA